MFWSIGSASRWQCCRVSEQPDWTAHVTFDAAVQTKQFIQLAATVKTHLLLYSILRPRPVCFNIFWWNLWVFVFSLPHFHVMWPTDALATLYYNSRESSHTSPVRILVHPLFYLTIYYFILFMKCIMTLDKWEKCKPFWVSAQILRTSQSSRITEISCPKSGSILKKAWSVFLFLLALSVERPISFLWAVTQVGSDRCPSKPQKTKKKKLWRAVSE